MGDVPLSDADFEAIAMAHPPAPAGATRRCPSALRAAARRGGLVCATSIEANAAVDVCEHKPEAIVRSAMTAVDEASRQLSASPSRRALRLRCKECAFSNPLAAREVESIISSFGDPARTGGRLHAGEIGRGRGAKGDRNYSLVVVALGPTS